MDNCELSAEKMGFCSVPGCSNRSDRDKTSFHKFPLKNPKLLSQWIHNIKRKYFTPNRHSRVCGVHFSDECFVRDKSFYCPELPAATHRQLKPDSVPTIFGHQPTSTERNHTVQRLQKREVCTHSSHMQCITRVETLLHVCTL